jgi:ankyrin repeat protein
LFAARSGDVGSVRLLVDAGANPNDALPDGMSALVLAAHSGQTQVGILLLEKGAKADSAEAGYTALHAAVLRSDFDLVKVLLAHGASPDIPMTKGTPLRRDTTDFNLPATLVGSTPYLLAAKFLEPEIMKALVAGGADPNVKMRDGATAVMVASGAGSGGNSSRRGIAVIDGGKVEPESRVLEAVAAAIDLGGDVNGTSQAGDTALHIAASQGHDSVVQLLADRGAQLSVKNKRGLTPLGVLTAAGGGPRRRGAAITAAAIVDDDPAAEPTPRQTSHPETVELLKKLGAQ